MTNLTEEQAFTKWCPFARSTIMPRFAHETGPPTTANRGNTDNDCLCIASGCMMWEWAPDQVKKNWSATKDIKPPVPDDGWEIYGDVYETTDELPQFNREAGEKQYCQTFRRRTGHCGLTHGHR